MADEYEVISIDELQRVRDTGGLEKYYRHRIRTKGGVVLTVDIDPVDFTPEKTGPILSKAAKNADKIKSL